MKRVLRQGILLMAAVGLVACGGGGGNGGGGATPTAVEGVAIDGYLRYAKACLDLNDNLVCEVGEPYDFTDTNGRYSLTAPSAAVANSHRVIVEVIGGLTIDADAPTAAIPNSYVLTAPLGQHGVISPLTTLAYQLQADQPGLSLDEAAAQLRVMFALPSDLSLWADYASANASAEQQDLHQLAKVLARASGVGLQGVKNASGGVIADSDKRAALLVVWNQLVNQSDHIVSTLGTGVAPAAVDVAFTFDDLPQQLMLARLPKSAVTDGTKLVIAGLYAPNGLPLSATSIAPSYGQFAALGAVGGGEVKAVDSRWLTSYYNDAEQSFESIDLSFGLTTLKAGRWTAVRSDEQCRHTPIDNGFHLSCGTGVEEDQRINAIALAGRGIDVTLRHLLSSWLADVWRVSPERLFSPAATAYQMMGFYTNDFYLLGDRLRDAEGNPFPSLNGLMANNTVTSTNGLRIGSSQLGFKFDGVTDDSGTLSMYEVSLEDNVWTALPLKGQWERKRVGEETVVEFNFPAAYSHYTGLRSDWRVGWAEYTPPGGAQAVYAMSVRLKGSPVISMFFNTAAMDDLKAARGTAVPAS